METDSPPIPCPDCRQSFASETALKKHYAVLHDGSLSREYRECVQCGTEMWVYKTEDQQYCSRKCAQAASDRRKRDGN